MSMNPRLLRPLASGFSPRQIAGLAAWWDSTDNSTITTDTGVSAWVDKSGNGYTLEQSTGANQPTISSINGKQAFDYNGSSQFLRSEDAGVVALASGAAAPELTTFCVAVADVTADQRLVSFASNSDSNTMHLTAEFGTGSEWRVFYRPGPNGTPLVTGTGGAYSTATPYVVTYHSGSTLTGRANGSQQVAEANTLTASGTSPTLMSLGCLLRVVGGTPNTAANFLNGRIGDVLIYNRVLTTAEIQRVERWLAGKFGVALA